MTSDHFYILVCIWTVLAILLFPVLLKITAPYGRHSRSGWGPMIPNRLGWIIMELPALAVFSYFFLKGNSINTFIPWIYFVLWNFHYINRSLIYPFRTKTGKKSIPAIITVFAFVFNTTNGFLNGFYLGTIAESYPVSWFYNPCFITGIIFFITGLFINLQADKILLSLRKPNDSGYSIPHGGPFRWISCPNFFGEMIEWAGFAIMTLSPAALSFVIWTMVNLIPRALDHHKWYKERFEDYPSSRKAVLPYLL